MKTKQKKLNFKWNECKWKIFHKNLQVELIVFGNSRTRYYSLKWIFFGLSPLFQFDFITNFTMYRTVGCFCFKLSIQFNSICSLFQFLILFFVGNTLLFSLLWIYNTFHLFFFIFFFCQTVFFFVGSFGQNTNAMKTVTWLTEFFSSMYLLHNLFVFNSI